MLSIEKPSTDPCQISSQLKCSDEIHKKLDLPNPNPISQQVSNFSIRDYVFAARCKDIKNNWPFSLKNLQLCFKHGVKDVLPPFQPRDSVKNNSIKRHASEIISSDIQNINHVVQEPCGQPNDHEILNQKLLDTCTATKCSCGQSEIESVHNDRPSSSIPPIKTDSFLEDSIEIEGVASRFSHKTDNESGRTANKKCKLIVKFGGNSDHSSLDDMASNCTTLSESIASKVCPVCRTFSSSSNTTLNAHIDQCLSIESSPKWTTMDSKLTRHSRIKPRRTRLMVDIYVDAKRCTLEELDRRNGRIANVITQKTEKKVEMSTDQGIKTSRVHPVDVGPVYIDANGTKLRILSKFKDDQPVLKVGENLGLRLKALKGSKLSKDKKKKRHALMKHHHKYLHHHAHSKKIFNSPKATHTSQVYGPQEMHHRDGESVNEEGHQILKPTKPNDAAGTLQQWVCSNRTKKSIDQDDRHSYKKHDHRDQSCSRDSVVVGRTRIQRFTNLSENVLSSPQSGKRKCKPINEKRLRTADDMEKRSPMKQNFMELRKDGPSMHDRCQFKPSEDSDGIPTVRRKTFTSNHASTVPKSLKFSSSENNLLSESSFGEMRKCSAFRNTDSHVDAETDEEVNAYHSEEGTENQFGTEESTDDDVSLDFANERTVTKVKTATFQSYSLDEEENSESSGGGASDYILDKANSFNSSVMSWRKSLKLTIPIPMDPSLEDSTFCNHEVGNDNCMRVYSAIEAGKGNSFDPILIPGPPGSFLPSPRDMGSDDFQGNSSLTTSHVHSSQDQRELVDGGSSTSPISAVSSILNASVSVKTTPDGDFFKRPLGFGKDDDHHQPCCCQKKGRVSQVVILNSQELQLLKRRQARRKEWDNNPNTRTSHLDIIGPGNFPVSSYANFEPEKVVLPVMKSPEASSPASNPVLRLMGKNLMVINKDDDALARHVVPDSARSMGQCFNAASLWTSYRTCFNYPEPGGVFLDRSQTMNGRNFGDLTPRHNYEGDCMFLPNRSNNRQNAENNASCKEIILIDDIPEDNNQISASMPTVFSYNVGPINAFARFQGSSLRGESAESPPVGPNIDNHATTAFR